ncbi:hypothetical protein V6N12_019050 [Hibiscus sabdariffa]|uniref:protein-serine/threonine phosphatase n=1 Tax=Hibiscus sabdariffa TaxID=183260 RepID=A0ABR2BA23_9ROSI
MVHNRYGSPTPTTALPEGLSGSPFTAAYYEDAWSPDLDDDRKSESRGGKCGRNANSTHEISFDFDRECCLVLLPLTCIIYQLKKCVDQFEHWVILGRGFEDLGIRRGNKTLYAGVGLTSQWNWNREFGTSVKMMVDSGATANGPVVDTFPKKDCDGKYLSGRWRSEDGKLSCGYSSFKGRRGTMEDFYDAKTSKINGQTVCMFGVFDGHGGSRAAEYLKQHLFENLMKHPKFMTDTKLAISETYQQTDVDFLDSVRDSYRDDGSTASTAVLVGSHLYVANVGDSRTVISKAGKAIPLSEDHKPNRSDERKRIEDAGGVVMWTGTWRVGGVLAMSRAFGNRMLKQYVVAEPEIQDKEIDEECELLVLASDGLWDVVPNEDAISLALEEEDPEMAAIKLTETAFTRGSTDNITCIVVRFHHHDKAADPVNPQV